MHATLYQKRGSVWNGTEGLSPARQTRVDGHCPFCKQSATFEIAAATTIPSGDPWSNVFDRRSFDRVDLVCTRAGHRLLYFFYINGLTITKVGQYPSLADIANDEAATYRDVLDRDDAAELHKAIGLAAHGVGIGSFVYLRRIFERLITKRFLQFKEQEGWNDEDFFKLRMDEKVHFLAGHLPSFLVENKRLYSILSKGIHELSEDVCLRAFEPIKLSMKIILDEDKKVQEQLKLRELASIAIADFDAQK
ncbi:MULTISPECIES: short-chain dehydrogenase [unclassified Ruegeria]|uniref:short-chain dehydrogenase n=1 Tax=unclassified Ruegeria TaxID=2625375 RepID=UPI001492CE09|nr:MULTISPECIES: short-chain dehydrogenase [unclassified Ruegeria]NOD86339.1 short-chain dehydrogenase [Ruegeria sp. HKCCD6119]